MSRENACLEFGLCNKDMKHCQKQKHNDMICANEGGCPTSVDRVVKHGEKVIGSEEKNV